MFKAESAREPILSFIPPGARVLDLGCGDGQLLQWLIEKRGADALGVDRDPAAVETCLRKGLPVYQGDFEETLADYCDKRFDLVVLNQTLQATQRPVAVLRQMARVGRQVIVGYPNFGHFEIRLKLLTTGRMPNSRTLPYSWHDTPNIHLFTVADFQTLCQEEGLTLCRSFYQMAGQWLDYEPWPGAANLLASNVVSLLQLGQ